MSRLPVFAGLGSEILFSSSVVDQAAKDADSPEARLLLKACFQVFVEELDFATGRSCGVDVEDFPTAESLLRPSTNYHHNTAIQHAFICLMQLLRYLSVEGSITSKLLGASGFCAGLLPAVAAATSKTSLEYLSRAQDCFRVAFKIGIASEQSRGPHSKADGELPWSLIVDKLSEEEAKSIISEASSAVYVSARNTENCVSLSGEGAALRQFVDTRLPQRCRIRSTNVFTLYHNSHALSEISARVFQEIKEGGFSFPDGSELVCPIFHTHDGSRITSAESSSSDQLLKRVLEMIFLESVDWVAVQDEILKSGSEALAAGVSSVQVQNFGPGYGALVYRKDLPKGMQVVDVAVSKASTQKWAKDDIAIVGAGLDVPGAQMDYNVLWENIMNGINTCSEIPADRFRIEDYHQDDKSKLGNKNRSMDTQYGSFLENPWLFDNTFFGISPREARSMDPQQRLLLQTAQRALEDAGYSGDSTPSNQTASFGCYIGAATGDYADNLKEEMDVYWVPGVLRSFLSGRISYAYGWGGPSLTVDTACSSSIVAIWQAARAIQTGDCKACIAGGVNIVTSPDMYIGLDRAHFLSPTGPCHSFDSPSDGYCRADGSALIVMKRMEDALAENDRILGVIKGVECNQSGTAHSITHPHTPTQERLFKKVWQKNNINPHHVSVVEAHGTGTGAGDPSELHGITNSLCVNGRDASNPLFIGSIKANIGHSEAASGCASLIKILMMMKNKTLPPQPRFNKENHNVADLAPRGVVVNRESKPWIPKEGIPRMAMLNNFGGAGSNGALIVQEYENIIAPAGQQLTYCFGISTKSTETLATMRDEFVTLLDAQRDKLNVRDICYSSTARKILYPYRLSTTASSAQELIQNLQRLDIDAIKPQKVVDDKPKAVFLFSGQGSQYLGMGKELMTMFPQFAETVNKCHLLLSKWGMPSCLEVINAPEAEANPEDTTQLQAFQTGVFVLEVALAQLVMSFGVTPKAVAGHSLGEYAALVIAGVMDLTTGLKLVAQRAALIVRRCGLRETCMLAVSMPAKKMQEVLEKEAEFNSLSISCDNSPDDCVVGGPTQLLQSLKEHVSESMKVKSKMLDVPVAYHTDALAPVTEALTELAQEVKLSAPFIPVASNLLGRVVPAGEDAFKPDYFARHCVHMVEFDQCMESLMSMDSTAADGCWIEIGPHPIVTPMLNSRHKHKQAQRLFTLKKKTHPSASISQLLSGLYQTTSNANFRKAFEGLSQKPSLVTVPGVPFARQTFFVEYPRDYESRGEQIALSQHGSHDGGYVGTPYQFLTKVVQAPAANESGIAVFDTPIQTLYEYITGHTVCGYALCPASVYCELALAAVHALEQPGTALSLSQLTIPKSLVYKEDAISREDLGIVVRVTVKPSDQVHGLREVAVSSYDRLAGTERSQVHARGLVKSRSVAEVAEKYANLGDLLDQQKWNFLNLGDLDMIEKFSSSVFYDKVFTRTVNYAEMYRSIESIKINTPAKEALASCKLPLTRTPNKFVADPIMVDALFHVGGFMANLFAKNDEICICNFVKSATVLRDVASTDRKFQIHASNYEIAGGKTILSDAQAIDSHGVFAVVKSMKFKRVKVSDRLDAYALLSQRSKVAEVPHEDIEMNVVSRAPKNEDTRALLKGAPPVSQASSAPSTAQISPHSSPDLSSASSQSSPSEQENEVPTPKSVGFSTEAVIAETCGTDETEVTPNTVLESLGIDSLMVHELRDKLSTLSKMDLSVSEMTNCTIVEDIDRLINEQDLYDQALPETTPTTIAAVESLSSTPELPPSLKSDRFDIESPIMSAAMSPVMTGEEDAFSETSTLAPGSPLYMPSTPSTCAPDSPQDLPSIPKNNTDSFALPPPLIDAEVRPTSIKASDSQFSPPPLQPAPIKIPLPDPYDPTGFVPRLHTAPKKEKTIASPALPPRSEPEQKPWVPPVSPEAEEPEETSSDPPKVQRPESSKSLKAKTVECTQAIKDSVRQILQLDKQIQCIHSPKCESLVETAEPLPLFLVHPGSGLIVEYHKIKRFQRPIWTIHNSEFLNPGAWDGIPSMARAYASLVSQQTNKPCILGGWSFGGVVAFEAARMLMEMGFDVAGVALIDSPPPVDTLDISLPTETIEAAITPPGPRPKDPNGVRKVVRDFVRENYVASSGMLGDFTIEGEGKMPPRVVLLRAKDNFECPGRELPYHPFLDHQGDPKLVVKGWEAIVRDQVKMFEIPGNHFDLFEENNIASTSEHLSVACAEIQKDYNRRRELPREVRV